MKGLFEERLELKDIGSFQVRRLGKKLKDQSKIRPVVVSFVSRKDKERGLKAEAKFRGSEVYINQDMTKDQISLCKVLRKRKEFLIKNAPFKSKRITIFREKLWADKTLMRN